MFDLNAGLGAAARTVAFVCAGLAFTQCSGGSRFGVVRCTVSEDCLPGTPRCFDVTCGSDGYCQQLPAEKGTPIAVFIHSGDSCRRFVCDGNGSAECDFAAGCSSGECDSSNGCDLCPQLCGSCAQEIGDLCGNKKCDWDMGEGCLNCPQDCGYCCGDKKCDKPYESCEECSQDCCPAAGAMDSPAPEN
jgi:hypothetical protein